MSFKSVLGKIGHVIVGITDVAQKAAPAIEAIPGVGGEFGIVLAAVVAIEDAVTQANLGSTKKQAATTLINAQAPGMDQKALSDSIDHLVASLNALTAATAANTQALQAGTSWPMLANSFVISDNTLRG